jgi:septal ring factor EnvC (AmiA/AmiB activator)
MLKTPHKPTVIENIITWVGSLQSLIVHTVIFIVFFVSWLLGYISLESMLLILTTAVSLEAIYLAIFIQMTVNRHTRSLREVEEDIDEIQEDVEGLGENVDEIQEDIEEITEDIEEISEEDKEDEAMHKAYATHLDHLTDNIRRVLAELETMKKER